MRMVENIYIGKIFFINTIVNPLMVVYLLFMLQYAKVPGLYVCLGYFIGCSVFQLIDYFTKLSKIKVK